MQVLINSLRGFDFAAQPAFRQSARPYLPHSSMYAPSSSAVDSESSEPSAVETVGVYQTPEEEEASAPVASESPPNTNSNGSAAERAVEARGGDGEESQEVPVGGEPPPVYPAEELLTPAHVNDSFEDLTQEFDNFQ